jgi:hypothetical protein
LLHPIYDTVKSPASSLRPAGKGLSDHGPPAIDDPEEAAQTGQPAATLVDVQEQAQADRALCQPADRRHQVIKRNTPGGQSPGDISLPEVADSNAHGGLAEQVVEPGLLFGINSAAPSHHPNPGLTGPAQPASAATAQPPLVVIEEYLVELVKHQDRFTPGCETKQGCDRICSETNLLAALVRQKGQYRSLLLLQARDYRSQHLALATAGRSVHYHGCSRS